jgi:hypothetical protein
VTDFASTHLVKYSTKTMAKVQFPCAGVSLPTMSMLHLCSGQDGQSTAKVVQAPWSNKRISHKLHRFIPVWLHRRSLSANRILAGGP